MALEAPVRTMKRWRCLKELFRPNRAAEMHAFKALLKGFRAIGVPLFGALHQQNNDFRCLRTASKGFHCLEL